MTPLVMPAGWRVPILCAVTDRRGLGAGDGAASLDALLDQIAQAAAADLDLIQIREPDLSAAQLLALVARACEVVRRVPHAHTRIVVNDRLDVALAAGADGVHLRGQSVAASRIRARRPEPLLIGRSIHALDEARDVLGDGGLDYLIAGTIFPTASKPAGHATAGPALVREIAAISDRPVLAIGGITLDNVHEVAAAGAAGIAAIGLFRGAAGHTVGSEKGGDRDHGPGSADSRVVRPSDPASALQNLPRVADHVRRIFAAVRPDLATR